MARSSRYSVMTEMRTRFDNRALKAEEVPRETLLALIEAASFAPSCLNEQPWRFILATGERREQLLPALSPTNREWAGVAPALILTLARKAFTQGGKDNHFHLSDAGCATGFMMLEAERRGLTAHPMAGFNRDQARATFAIPEDYAIVHITAVGWPGDVEQLSEPNRERNHPQPRKALEELLL